MEHPSYEEGGDSGKLFATLVIQIGVLLSGSMLFLETGAQTTIGPKVGIVEYSDQHPGVSCQVVESAMRDGTILRGYLYLPPSTGSESQTKPTFPTVIERSPYGRSMKFECFNDISQSIHSIAVKYAQEGFAFLMQSVRGTYISDGEFDALEQERADGYDTISWAATQPWSNGDIGVRGPSYHGVAALQAVVSMHPNLRAASLAVTAEDYHREWAYHHGVFSLAFNLGWTDGAFVEDAIVRRMRSRGASAEAVEEAVSQHLKLSQEELFSDWLWHLPMDSLPHLKGKVPSYYEWLAHPGYDQYWQRIDAGALIANVEYPILIHGAWYDVFANGAFETYAKVTKSGASPKARDQTKLIITQYGHALDNNAPTFGPEMHSFFSLDKNESPFDMDYFNKYLKCVANGYENRAKVQLAVMVPPDKGNTGYSFNLPAVDYPLPDTIYKEMFLASGGHANTRYGDGRLTDALSQESDLESESTEDSFSYNPLEPVPSIGGNYLFGGARGMGSIYKNGAAEQKEVELREDVLVYTSEPLESDWVVIGPIEATLFAKSNARDTDFTAKLVNVHPDGATHNIADGIVRARFRKGSKIPPSLIKPGRAYAYKVELGHTASVIPTGHRIRVQISSSNFPRFARNLNTGESNESSSEIAVADQVILHGKDHPSRITLPIATGITIPE